jgi:hypothetical protein
MQKKGQNLFSLSSNVPESRKKSLKFIRKLEAENRAELRRFFQRVKILDHLEGEAVGFQGSLVIPHGANMRFLLKQKKFLKSFRSDIGWGM